MLVNTKKPHPARDASGNVEKAFSTSGRAPRDERRSADEHDLLAHKRLTVDRLERQTVARNLHPRHAVPQRCACSIGLRYLA